MRALGVSLKPWAGLKEELVATRLTGLKEDIAGTKYCACCTGAYGDRTQQHFSHQLSLL